MSSKPKPSAKPAAAKASATPKKGDAPAVSAAQSEKLQKAKADYFLNNEECQTLRQEIARLEQSLDHELRQLNEHQLAKTKLSDFLSIEKENREQLKLELRSKLRAKQDLEEKQSYELGLYKKKVKHLLMGLASELSEQRLSNECELEVNGLGQRNELYQLNGNNRQLKKSRKTMEIEQMNLLVQMRQEQEKRIMNLRLEFERRSDELNGEYERKYQLARESADEQRREEIQRLELKKNTHIAELLKRHAKNFERIKKYFSDITHANLELIKNLKEEVGDMKKKEGILYKEVCDIKGINRKLTRPLVENRALVEDLKGKLSVYQEEKQEYLLVQQRLMELDECMKSKEWEREIWLQKCQWLDRERKELKGQLNQEILKEQQKESFHSLLKVKKIELLYLDLEKTNSALAEILASTNLHPEIIGDLKLSLEDVLMRKNQEIQRLEDHCDVLREKYGFIQRAMEQEMQRYQIPKEEIGFEPIRNL